MKKISRPLLLKALAAFLMMPLVFFWSACDSGVKSKDNLLADHIWDKTEILKYRIPVKEAGNKAFSMDMQHIHGYNIKDLNIQLVMTAPSGKEVLNKNYNIRFKNDDGSYISECSGDYCDLHQLLEPNLNLTETGDYTVSIAQNSGYDRVAGFLQLKLNLK